MAKHIKSPTKIEAAGNKAKIIEEFIGRANFGTSDLSIAKMQSPGGWIEPVQIPEFDEHTVVLRGLLKVDTKNESFVVREGEEIIISCGE